MPTFRHFLRPLALTLPLLSLASAGCAADAKGDLGAIEPKTHSFITFGAQTAIHTFTPGGNPDGTVTWKYPLGTREGWVLPSGNILLAIGAGQAGYPGGGVVEVTRENKTVWEYKGTQKEVASAQKTPDGTYVLAESGPNPRLLELDAKGTVLANIPLACQKGNAHMQTRMARKAADGTYWVPHLLDFAVKQYNAKGEVISSVDTTAENDPQHAQHTWPFTAVVLPNGHLLCGLTHGNRVTEFDAKGQKVWEVTNADVGGIIKDACAVQRLPNGNTVVTSYAAGAGEVSLWEVTPQKRVVWTWKGHGHVHSFQILDTDGKPLPGAPMK